MQSSMLTLMGFLALLFARGDAQALYIRASPSIYNGSYTYQYYGCYNETTDIDGSDHERALANGINEVKKGQMTVPMCLSFCSSGNDTYRYAGLEWSRECWCSQDLSGISAKLNDSQCSYPCEGDESQACGGSLKLSVYQLSSGAASLLVSRLALLLGIVTFWLF